MNDGGNNKALNYPTLSGLSNITSDDVNSTTISTDILSCDVLTVSDATITNLTVNTLSVSDLSCNTLIASTSVDTPLLTGAGNLNISYVGGVYSNSPEFNIDTTGGYGGIAFTSQFDIDLQPLTGKINLNGKVNQSIATRNVCYGTGAMDATITSAVDNTGIGYNSLQSLTTGDFNVCIGGNSGDSISSGNYNVSCGFNSLINNNSNANVAIGFESLKTFTGSNTTSCGYQALRDLSSGTVCTAYGASACALTSTADAVSGYGFLSLNRCNGSHNSSFGYFTDRELTTGTANCTFGSISGCTNSSYNAQSANSCFGYYIQTSGGSFNSYFGYYANSSSPGAYNYSTAIGAFATPTASNQIKLGTSSEYTRIDNYLDVGNYIITPTQPPLTNNTRVATTQYVDSAVALVAGVSLSGVNAWTGTNSFNVNLPTSTLAPSSGNDLVNKTYADTKGGLASANAWTGNTNTFNSFLPTSTLAPTTGNHLVNKTYADTKGGLASANAWTGNTNTFNSFLPTSTLAPTTANQFTNKNYVDTAVSNIFEYNKTLTINDDFLTGLNNTEAQWTQTVSGSGTGAVQASIVNHPGMYRFSTSTTVGSSAGIAMAQSSIFTDNLLSVEWIWRYNTNFNNSVIQVGYANGINTFTTSAVFRLQISPGNYQFVVNGTPVYTINKEFALLGLLQNKWLHGKIIIDFAAGTQAFQFTSLTDGITESDTYTAPITSSAITPICKISQLGSTASNMDMDFCSFKYSSTSRA